MKLGCATVDEEERNNQVNDLAKFLADPLGCRLKYALGFWTSQLLNAGNAVGQFFVIDWFLGDGVDFTSYGLHVLKADSAATRSMIRNKRFTSWAFCPVEHYGPSGTLQMKHIICHLPMNVVNGMAFLFMWFWLAILVLITVLSLVYWISFACCPMVRKLMLRYKTRPFAVQAHINLVADRFPVADMFLLLLLAENIDEYNFALLVSRLAHDLSQKEIHPEDDISLL